MKEGNSPAVTSGTAKVSRAERRQIANEKRRLIANRIGYILTLPKNEQSREIEQLEREYKGEEHLLHEIVAKIDYKMDCKKEEFQKIEVQNAKLTPEQIENWRRVLFLQIGAYAMVMPAEEIQKYRDKVQSQADNWRG